MIHNTQIRLSLPLLQNEDGDLVRSQRKIGEGLTLYGAALPFVGRREERSVIHHIKEQAFLLSSGRPLGSLGHFLG